MKKNLFILFMILYAFPFYGQCYHGQNQIKGGKCCKLVNKETGKVIIETNDDSYSKDYKTYRLELADDKNAYDDNHAWTLIKNSNGTVRFVSRKSLKNIHKTNEYNNKTKTSGFVVTYEATPNSPEQDWILHEQENGFFRIENAYVSGQYLSALDNITTELYSDGADDQQWKIVMIDKPLSSIPNVKPIFPLEELVPIQPKDQFQLNEVSAGSVQIEGYVNNAIMYVQEKQLKQTDWLSHVDQFRYTLDTGGAWKGEFWGKMVRGACMHYKYTQDKELYEALKNTVCDLLSTQEMNGRISTYPIDREFKGWDMWCRKYVMLGFQSFYDICDDENLKSNIMKGLCIHADYILTKVGKKDGQIPINLSAEDWQGMPAVSILEPMINLYRMTGYKRYLDFSTYIVDEGGAAAANIFELAYQDKIYPYMYIKGWAKAYEMSSCFEGLAEYAHITGIAKWKQAVINYCKKVAEGEITITGSGGGDGPRYNVRGMAGEQWNKMAEEQTNPDIQHMQETCVTVTWLKLCEKVLRMTQNPLFADYIEKTIYNSLLGAIKGGDADHAEGPACEFYWDYFSLMKNTRNNNGGGYIPGLNSCCPANGPSATGLIPFIQTMTSKDGIAINLYNPGSVNIALPDGKFLMLKTITQYPLDGSVKIIVDTDSNQKSQIKFRIPQWSKVTTIKIDGKPIDNVRAGDYCTVDRVWNKGTLVEIDFDMRTRIVQSPQGQKSTKGEYLALERGPIVLARDIRFQDGSISNPVRVRVDENGYAVVREVKDKKFNNHMEFHVSTLDNKGFRVTDYASAGSTWDNKSCYVTWLPVQAD